MNLEFRALVRFVDDLEVVVDELFRLVLAESLDQDAPVEAAQNVVVGRDQSRRHNQTGPVQ